MNEQTLFLPKPSTTVLTHMRCLSRVSKFVVSMLTSTCEPFIAVLTRVREASIVFIHVEFEMTARRVGVVTYIAFEMFIPCGSV